MKTESAFIRRSMHGERMYNFIFLLYTFVYFPNILWWTHNLNNQKTVVRAIFLEEGAPLSANSCDKSVAAAELENRGGKERPCTGQGPPLLLGTSILTFYIKNNDLKTLLGYNLSLLLNNTLAVTSRNGITGLNEFKVALQIWIWRTWRVRRGVSQLLLERAGYEVFSALPKYWLCVGS